MGTSFKSVDGGVVAPQGFMAAGVEAGIKGKGKDVALLVSDVPAVTSGTFTSNAIKGATVLLCQDRLIRKQARAIVINSKNANACNGAKGHDDAQKMAAITAWELGIGEEEVLVCSTGTIGIPLPMDRIEAGIKAAAATLSAEGGDDAAKAIMTTDTVDKQLAFEIVIDGKPVRLGGMAKGAGMIEPNMATLLVFLSTDAAVDADAMQSALSHAVELSFNRVSVDGDQSCNDTALMLANGIAGNQLLNPDHPDWDVFISALNELALQLALKIAADGEGATKLVTVNITGAASSEDAGLAARAVCNSLLVKTSWFGGDPNWGRVICALGYSGAKMDPGLVDISYDDVRAISRGQLDAGSSLKELEQVLTGKEFSVNVDLHLGDSSYRMYTCDCSYDYVKINASYMT